MPVFDLLLFILFTLLYKYSVFFLSFYFYSSSMHSFDENRQQDFYAVTKKS